MADESKITYALIPGTSFGIGERFNDTVSPEFPKSGALEAAVKWIAEHVTPGNLVEMRTVYDPPRGYGIAAIYYS